MSDENIHKDELLSEDAFIRFCNRGYLADEDRLQVTKKFIDAAKKDRLIAPLLSVKEEQTTQEGKIVKRKVDYYSPHQLFLLVGLRRNIIKKGRLSSARQMAWAAVPTRTVLWGAQYSYTVNSETGEPLGVPSQLDIPQIAKHLHNFLRLVHSQPQTNEADKIDYHRERYFNGAPKVRFVFDALEEGKVKLSNFDLKEEDLVQLRYLIGQLATNIDPMEHWYYYIEKHPQWRKDKLKGDALLAQELYLTETIVVDVLSVATGKPQPSLVELLHEGSPRSMLTPSIEYAQGCDAKAMQAGINNLRGWGAKKENKEFKPEGFEERLAAIDKHLKEFVDRYGDRIYLHGVIRKLELEDIPLEDLDPISEAYVKAKMARYQNTKIGKDGKEHFITSYWDELNQEGDLTWEERRALDVQWEQQSEIARAIEDRLTSIQRELWELAGPIREDLISKESAAWRESQNPYGQLRDKETDQRLFNEAKGWQPVKDAFSDVTRPFSLAYCQVCRERPVQLHYTDGDRQVSTAPICDNCIAGSDDLLKLNPAEWRCDHCDSLLYKFAYQNKLHTTLLNGAVANVQLDYGRAQIKVRCTNRSCKQDNVRVIDWGWSL